MNAYKSHVTTLKKITATNSNLFILQLPHNDIQPTFYISTSSPRQLFNF